MKSNVLHFPKELTAQKNEINELESAESKAWDERLEESFDIIDKMNDLDLMRLREAFDKARLDWPEEEAELPEKNKRHSFL
ncbi:hypothetical protein MED121_23639 [Marinomonas sp. MED121]|uniref:hypothetical protein n=1 Tax=Marinomonas sp. MED121 TaxID=314277 RepID=UPI00006904D6|nr:hypothetical protein [Marinomonas sp. MED121]EAQ64795.1 hypothetical protein MED121_23639 [Marinomonas sp. MED121]